MGWGWGWGVALHHLIIISPMNSEHQLQETPLSILLLPWLAHGHISPFLHLAKTLSSRNLRIFFCSTPVILDSIKPSLSSPTAIQLVELRLPSSPELPPHLHTTKGLPPPLMPALKQALSMASHDFRTILQTLKPHLLIFDSLQPWAPQVASSLNIPAINFNTTGASMISIVLHFLHSPASKFPFSGFSIHNYWKNMYSRADGSTPTDEAREGKEGLLKCLCASSDVILVHSFRELEGKYIDYFSHLSSKKVIPIGPFVDEPNQDWEDHLTIRNWLDEKEPASTVFVSFGSEYFPKKEEMEEMAHGLEVSKANFIWVVRFPQGDERSSVEEALPEGFLERVGERAMVVKDWAPQIEILKHRSIGGFVSHCGWNSVMESLKIGVPVIGVPMHLDQPFNALVVEEAGVGVEARRDEEGRIQGEELGKLIREVVVEKTRDDVRNRAREMRELLSKKPEESIDELLAQIYVLCNN